MGLFRLFWVPEGRPPAEGTYVHYPAADLLGVLALESERARALVIGEDLGTVAPGVREQLAAERVLSYRLAWFERDAGGRRRAADYPRLALTAATTHDLPTVTGFFSGEDLARLHGIGVVSEADLAGATASQQADREELIALLIAEGVLAPEHADDLDELRVALHAFLARTPSMLVAATLEDAVGISDRPNVPGTIDQYPNWSLPLPVLLDELAADPRVRRLAAVLTAERPPRSARPGLRRHHPGASLPAGPAPGASTPVPRAGAGSAETARAAASASVSSTGTSCGFSLPALMSSAQWQATVCPGPSWRSAGTSSWQRVGCRYGQRVWKRQPGGGSAGEGRSPVSRMRRRFSSTSGSGMGMADSSAIVYGCSGVS